jgi:acyl dehydratase
MAESRFTWEGTELGQEFRFEFDLTPELVREFAWGVDDENPWYTTGGEPFRRPIAPPYMLSHLFAWVTLNSLGPAAGHIHAWSETESLNPAYVGSRIRLEAKIVDKFIRRGRGYFRMEGRAVDENGRELCRETRESAFSYEKIAQE